MSFERKKDRTNNAGLYIGYLNGLRLNEDVVCKNVWTIDDISNRTEKLVEFYMSEFKL